MDNYLIDINIRWNNGECLLLTVSSLDSISIIKQLIRKNATEQTNNKTMRLIHRGQMLIDDKKTLVDYHILETQVFIHCALSDPTIPTNTVVAKAKNTNTKLTLSGFDKLRESGYNDEEIRSIRTEFHQLHASLNYIDGETPSLEELHLEEEWIESSGNILPEVEQNSYKEMLCGLLLGFFLGILCLFWVNESVFTRRHQMGIMAGMFINFCGVVHVYF